MKKIKKIKIKRRTFLFTLLSPLVLMGFSGWKNNYTWVKYLNNGGESNVESYKIEPSCISVKFWGTDRTYTYSYNKAGKINVEHMKLLAKSGQGLNSFINKKVYFLYD